jgi:uncharacterized protein YoxC
MSTDPPALGKGLFGYRKGAVNQIIADRDIMLRQAEGRVRAAESRVAELEHDVVAVRERNNRMEEQLERLRLQLDQLVAPGELVPPVVREVETPEASPSEPSGPGAGVWESPTPEPAQETWQEHAEEFDTYPPFVVDETAPPPAGVDVSSEVPYADNPEDSERPASDPAAPELAAEPGQQDWDAVDTFGPEADAEPGDYTYSYRYDWPEDGAEATAVHQPAQDPAPVPQEQPPWELSEFPAEPEAPREESEPEPAPAAEADQAAQATPEPAPAAQVQEPRAVQPPSDANAAESRGAVTHAEASDAASRLVTDEVGEILTVAQETAARIIERAKNTTERQIAQSNKLWEDVQTEVARLASWRADVEPVIRTVQSKVESVRDLIDEVPERIRSALAPMAESISSIDSDLAELASACTPPLLLTPGGLDPDGEADPAWSAVVDEDEDAEAGTEKPALHFQIDPEDRADEESDDLGGPSLGYYAG